MEQTEYQIWALYILNVFNPLLSATGHFFEFQTFPNRLVKPIWYSWGKHADDADFYAIDIMGGIRLDASVNV